GFFRDPPLWRAMAEVVLPALRRAYPGRDLRAWCIGAATGEEAWTLAMLLAEACATAPSFALIASDLDRRTLELARLGCYAAEAVLSVPPSYRRFLAQQGSRVSVTAELRAPVRFAHHDLL